MPVIARRYQYSWHSLRLSRVYKTFYFANNDADRFQDEQMAVVSLLFSHLVRDPLGPALGLVLSAADLLPGQIAVLHQGPPAHLGAHVLGKVHHLDVAYLAEYLVTFLLLQ